MAREQSAFAKLGLVVLEQRDALMRIFSRDGVIDADEQAALDCERFIGNQLERGDVARRRSEMIQDSWILTDSPHTVRMIREHIADVGDDGPDDGAPQLKAA